MTLAEDSIKSIKAAQGVHVKGGELIRTRKQPVACEQVTGMEGWKSKDK